MSTVYAAGGVYCPRRRCRVLHRVRGRVRRVDDPGGRDPCPRHAEPTADSDQSLAEADVDPDEVAEEIAADLIEAGECPWCDDYSGGHVGQHASSAHPKKWSDYKDD